MESSLEFPSHLQKTSEQNDSNCLLTKIEKNVQEENKSCFQLPEEFSHSEMLHKQNEETFFNQVEDLEESKSDTVVQMETTTKTKKVKKLNFCPCCEYRTLKKGHLNVHIDTRHPEHGDRNFICDKCSMSFIFQSSLNAHVCKDRKSDKHLKTWII